MVSEDKYLDDKLGRRIFVVMYDAYGDEWVDGVYDNEEAAEAHIKEGPWKYRIEYSFLYSSREEREEVLQRCREASHMVERARERGDLGRGL